jgi:hypothetical protein
VYNRCVKILEDYFEVEEEVEDPTTVPFSSASQNEDVTLEN